MLVGSQTWLINIPSFLPGYQGILDVHLDLLYLAEQITQGPKLRSGHPVTPQLYICSKNHKHDASPIPTQTCRIALNHLNSVWIQWEFQDPKMEVLYLFGGRSPYIALKNRPKIYGRYLQSIGSCCMAIDG